MKESLTAALFLVLSSIILLILFIGGYALYLGSGFSMISMEVEGRVFISMLMAKLPVFLPLTLTFAFFFTFLRLKSRPGFRILTFLLLFSVSWGLLWFSGFILTDQNLPPRELETRSAHSFEAGKIYRLGEGRRLFIGKIETGELQDLSSPEKEGDIYLLNYYPRGTLGDNDISVRDRRGEIQQFVLFDKNNADSGHPLRVAAFPLPGSGSTPGVSVGYSRIFNDFTLLGNVLLQIRDRESLLLYMISICAFSLYLVSCWGFIRISRWPLFNAVLVMFLLLSAGSLYRIFSNPMFEPLAELIKNKSMGVPLGILVLAGVSLVLILLDILFIPYHKRIAEEKNE